MDLPFTRNLTSGRSIFLRQVRVLTVANLKSRYRKTWIGFIWVILNPLVLYGVQSLVFMNFLKIKTANYPLFLLTGLLPWVFIVQSLEMCTPLIVVHGRLFKSFPVHPLVHLFAQLLDNGINFISAFMVVLIPLCFFRPSLARTLLLLPLPLVVLFMGVLGMVWLLATLQVFFRDTRFMVSFILNVTFFLTPIFYPKEMIPSELRWLTEINLIHFFIEPIRAAVYLGDWRMTLQSLLPATSIAVALLAGASLFWEKKKNAVYFNL